MHFKDMTNIQIAEAQYQRAIERHARAIAKLSTLQSVVSELALNVERMHQVVLLRKARAIGDTTNTPPDVSTIQRDSDSVHQVEGGAPPQSIESAPTEPEWPRIRATLKTGGKGPRP